MNKRISIKIGKRLIQKWDEIVTFYIESPYAGRFSIYDYLHKMDTRDALEDYVDRQKKNARKELIPLVELVDLKLIKITEPCSCIWGADNQKRYDWTPSKHWWLFRKPKDIPTGQDWGWKSV